MEVVINTCYGGFGLSDKALEHMKLIYGDDFEEDKIERDNPRLVEMVKLLGSEASGELSELSVTILHGKPSGYEITEHDGYERVFPVYPGSIIDTEERYWEHDCNYCNFLGGVVINGKRTDAYVCKSSVGRKFDSIISRFGHGEEENSSVNPSAFVFHPSTAAALSLYFDYIGARGHGGSRGWVSLESGEVFDL